MFHFGSQLRRRGYGKAAVAALLQHAAAKYDAVDLEPAEGSEGFWLKCGFKQRGCTELFCCTLPRSPRSPRLPSLQSDAIEKE